MSLSVDLRTQPQRNIKGVSEGSEARMNVASLSSPSTRRFKRQRPDYRGLAGRCFLLYPCTGRLRGSVRHLWDYKLVSRYSRLAYNVPKTIKRGRALNHYLAALETHAGRYCELSDVRLTQWPRVLSHKARTPPVDSFPFKVDIYWTWGQDFDALLFTLSILGPRTRRANVMMHLNVCTAH